MVNLQISLAVCEFTSLTSLSLTIIQEIFFEFNKDGMKKNLNILRYRIIRRLFEYRLING